MRDRETRYAGRTDVVCPRESGSVLAATVLAGLLVLATTTSLIARNESQEGARPSDGLVIREALGITLPRRTVSNVISGIPLEAWFSSGRADIPAAGKSVRFPDGREARWERVVADSEGWFSGEWPAEKFVAVLIERKSPVRMLLEGMGHDIVYVNGTPRAGNPYRQKDTYEPWEPHFDYSRIPLELGEGENLLLFRYSRGRLKIKLDPLTEAISFNPDDTTLPDAVVGTPLDAWGSILLTNGTGAAARGLSLVCAPAGGHPDTFAVGSLPAMGVRKGAFKVRLQPPAERSAMPVRLTLLDAGRKVMDTLTIAIRVVGDQDARRETFISEIDGSVQYYGVMPQRPGQFAGRPALFLSLHGAGVEALNQAGSYAPKNWGVVIAPTNRRPYGFSWEDWGRMDALEVLDLTSRKFNIDEGRVYLTGHSMGGHGTWFMGATYPDKFAAIGPSAGWITFHSYRFSGAPEESSAVQLMLRRAAAQSDLFSLADNYRHFGVYIIHGDQDDNVPPQQSHMMIDRLKVKHKDFVYHEQPGAGHWWDNSPEPGADCVDWRPMFDFFARHIRPGAERILSVEFTTANPGISATDAWLKIDAQEHQLSLSTAQLILEPGQNQVTGTTSNVARLAIRSHVFDPSRAATVSLDGQKITIDAGISPLNEVWFGKTQGTWHRVGPPAPGGKNAQRYGTFKESFRNRMALVYGTGGTEEENTWAFERARYDAEKLWYQGNASVDVIADTEFNLSADPDRNVVLYGNSKTHRLWQALLSASPVKVSPGRVEFGEKTLKGTDLCCLFVRPRPGSAVASVGVVSGTGIQGMRLSHVARYLEPGLGLPDITVFNSEILTKGDTGVVLTGFFGLDWSIPSGEFVRGSK